MAVRVRYFTDPASAGCFGNEPLLRKLMVEFGAEVHITYVMGGLARTFEGQPGDRIREWLDVSDRSGMPIDPRLWLEGPIHSSYPGCMAVKAAAEQSSDGGYRYLRAVQEGLLCFRRKLDSAEALVNVAREAGLDAERFRIDLESHATVEAFGADLEATRAEPDLELPSISFDGGETLGPDASYERWREAARAAGAEPGGDGPPPVADALARFGRMAPVEVGAVCDLPGPTAAAELWRMAAEWRARPVPVLAGSLFEPA
jgi:predicted DsbA family dithiol-disulfide isomerase